MNIIKKFDKAKFYCKLQERVKIRKQSTKNVHIKIISA